MQIAMVLAGYTLGEADILRRAMGKKKAEEMAAQKEKFIEGCRSRKINTRKADKIFNLMEQFAGYGFNKSHSAAYALLAYQTAYLKTHDPVYFMSAVLTNEMGNTDKIVKYINECRDLGIEILPPDINQSDLNFTPAIDSAQGTTKIRFGMAAIKNVGEHAIKAILETRRAKGPFKSIFDFCERVDLRALNKRMMESLIRAGCFDSLGARRSQLAAVVDRAMEAGAKAQRDRESGQSGLFAAATATVMNEKLPDLEEWQEHIVLNYEKETLGFFITGHPLAKYAKELEEFSTGTTETLAAIETSRDAAVAGILTSVRFLKTRRGDRMASAVLEDMHGTLEVVVFPEPFKLYESLLKSEDPVFIKGRADIGDTGKVKIIVSELQPLKDLRLTQAKRMVVHVNLIGLDSDAAPRLLELFEKNRGDCAVVFELEHDRQFLVTLKPDDYVRVRPHPHFIRAVEEICGIGAVKLMP